MSDKSNYCKCLTSLWDEILKDTLRLKVKISDLEDIRTLVVRMSEENLAKIYDDISEYRDGKPIRLEKDGKKVYAIAQDALRSREKLGNNIRLDGWMRRRLNTKVGEEVNIKTSRLAPFILFWKTMVLRHPDLNQRWENFGIFLAIAVFIFDVFMRMIELHIYPEILVLLAISTAFLFLTLPPIILVPRK